MPLSTRRAPVLVIGQEGLPQAVAQSLAERGHTNPIYCFAYPEQALDLMAGRGRFADAGELDDSPLILIICSWPTGCPPDALRALCAESAVRAAPVVAFLLADDYGGIDALYASGVGAVVPCAADAERLLEGAGAVAEYWLRRVAPRPRAAAVDGLAPAARPEPRRLRRP